MKVSAFQSSGPGSAQVRPLGSQALVSVEAGLDDDRNVYAFWSVTKSFYVGGAERGYIVRISLKKDDLLELIRMLDKAEVERSDEVVRWRRQYERERIAELEHQEKLAKRREAYSKKKLAKSGKNNLS